MPKTLKQIRDVVRRRIRDESTTAPVFTDSELNDYIADAINNYSDTIPREISGTLTLQAGVSEYTKPDGFRSLSSLILGSQQYAIPTVFAGIMTVTPTPSTGGVATFAYLGRHTVPTQDTEALTVESQDESCITEFARAMCWATLAGDAARYYRYKEGVVEEDQGKVQAQYRAEADSIFEAVQAKIESAQERVACAQPGADPQLLRVVSRSAPERPRSIYKTWAR